MDAIHVAIYGAGGFAREVAWLLEDCPQHELVAFIDDSPHAPREIHGIEVLAFERFTREHKGTATTIAIANPKIRERLARKCELAGVPFATVAHPSARMSKRVRLSEGSIICCGNILTVDIDIGRHVHINLDCTIGHDVRIGDHVTLAPGVHVSGNVHIERGVTIGTGATIINGMPGFPIVIGEHAVIGAGACVTKSVEAGCLYAGVPAVLKKRYPLHA
jgi:sugar O-acyltransferase (sialic acid O-acetyltransferase NeuD family)